MPFCRILRVFCIFIHCLISRSSNQRTLLSLGNGCTCGWEIISIHHMICLHHTPRAPSSPICAGLWFPSLPQHLFFQLGVTSELHSLQSPGPCLKSLYPFTAVTHLSGGPQKDYFPCTYPCLSFYHTCQAKFNPNSSAGHLCLYPWRKITRLEHWCLANP